MYEGLPLAAMDARQPELPLRAATDQVSDMAKES